MHVVCSSCSATVNVAGGDCCPRCGDLVDLYDAAPPLYKQENATRDASVPEKSRK